MFGNQKHGRKGLSAGRVAVLAGAALVVLAFLGCGPKGAGKACYFHHDCDDGLICDASTNTCETCGSKASCLGVELVVHSCMAEQSPFLREPQLGFRVLVTGDDLAPIQEFEQPSSGGFELPDIPLGTNRQLTIEAYKDGIDNVVARGSSRLFDLTPTDPLPKMGIFLRLVNEFTPTNDLENPTAPCEAMYEARVGHTATLLDNGKVLIVGGQRYDENGKAVPHSDVEVFDPDLGHFLEGAKLNMARTRHTATLLDDGRVLVAGGLGLINGDLTPLRMGEIYDPVGDTWTVVKMNTPRARHAALKLADGRVLLSGGQGAASSVEVFVPGRGAAESFAVGPTIPSRMDHQMVLIGEQRVVLVGGLNGQQPLDTTTTLVVAGEMMSVSSESPSLAAPVARPASVELGSGSAGGVLVLGGNELADWLQLENGELTHRTVNLTGEAGRSGVCTASTSRGALVVGGVDPEGNALTAASIHRRSPEDGSLVSESTSKPMFHARSGATCTSLASGAVLVLGGEATVEGKKVAQRAAEVFQP